MVPQAAYPESQHSSGSGPLNTLLKTKLREHALILRALHKSLHADTSLSGAAILSTLRAKKEELMKEVYTIMSATLGVPPRADDKFVWDYYDKDGKAGRWEGTPREFYKAFAYDKYAVRVLSIVTGEWARTHPPRVAVRLVLAHPRPAQRVRQALLRRQARQRLGRARRALCVHPFHVPPAPPRLTTPQT